ncbi:MAG: ABC transporter substrate-binding protein, partial [Candidatus Rokuibacteriota bacterium]
APGVSGAPADGPAGPAGPARPRAESPPRATTSPASTLPTVQIGALLPLSGNSAWFGKEMRQGLELAIAELNRLSEPRPADEPPAPPVEGNAEPSAAAPPPTDEGEAKPSAAPPPTDDALTAPGVHLTLEAIDVRAVETKEAAEAFGRLAAGRVPIVFTASATPTLTIQPLATARQVLLVHQGVVTSRVATPSRLLLHTRATIPLLVERLAAHAWESGIRRLALLAAGDDFGRAARAALGPAWRERGGVLAHQESLTPDTPDLAARLRRLARLGPDAVALAFRGTDLGDLAARLRDAGYTGRLLVLDDDPGALLAAGPALEDAAVVSDAFVPDDPRGERFVLAYKAKYTAPPSLYAANAYDALAAVAEGLRAAMAGGRDVPTGARVREALGAQRRFPSVYGPPLVLRDDGTFGRAVALFRVEGGKLAFVRYLGVPRS